MTTNPILTRVKEFLAVAEKNRLSGQIRVSDHFLNLAVNDAPEIIETLMKLVECYEEGLRTISLNAKPCENQSTEYDVGVQHGINKVSKLARTTLEKGKVLQ